MKIALIQMRSAKAPEENAQALETMIEQAALTGCEYVQTPEMTGILVRDREELMEHVRHEEDDLLVKLASSLARKHNISLHLGSTAILREDGKVANRAFLFSPDGTLGARYDKIHMFDVDLDNGESWRESNTYAPGEQAVVANVGPMCLGLSICYDLRFAALYRAMAQTGANVLGVPAAFTRQTGQAHWHTLLRARAIENGAFVLAAAQGGIHQDGRQTFGHSIVINPWGKVIAELNHDEPAILTTQIDLDEVARVRQKVPSLRHDRPYLIESTIWQ